MDILIADSSPLIRRLIREDLAPAGYHVLEADNGEEALRMCEARQPALVTLAMDLPRLSGLQVCERIRAAEARVAESQAVASVLPVLFITADDTLADRERGFAAGATEFMTKPFTRGQVRQAVDSILYAPVNWKGRQALVAEDSRLTRGIVVRALRRLGLEVLEAQDGLEALEIARASARRIVMVISDLMMPRMDGAQLCRELRLLSEFADVPFIVLSAASEREQVLRLFKVGATDYIIKPFSLEEMLARLKVHLDAFLLARDLEQRRDELEADLHLAQQVQHAALRGKPDTPWACMAIRYLPFGQVSGDLYDLSLNGDGALNVFLGDATGHGIGAAFMTMMVQTGLDSIGPDQPVDATLTRLHTLIHERAGDRFVTGVYLRLTPDGTATHASAGHPPIVFVPREGEARQLEDDAGLPLGLLDTPLPFAPEVVTLRAGDRLFLYTDGLTEWARVDGEQYSAERLTRYVAEHRALPLEACLEGLLEDARSFAAGASDTDDVTVIALEYTP